MFKFHSMPTRWKSSKIPPHSINPHAEANSERVSNWGILQWLAWSNSSGLGPRTCIELCWSWFSKEGFILCKTIKNNKETRERAGEVWENMRKRVELEYLRAHNGVEEIYCGAALYHDEELHHDEEEAKQKRAK